MGEYGRHRVELELRWPYEEPMLLAARDIKRILHDYNSHLMTALRDYFQLSRISLKYQVSVSPVYIFRKTSGQ